MFTCLVYHNNIIIKSLFNEGTYIHTRRTVHALDDKNVSSASLCVHEFCRDMKIASELLTNVIIYKIDVIIDVTYKNTRYAVFICIYTRQI